MHLSHADHRGDGTQPGRDGEEGAGVGRGAVAKVLKVVVPAGVDDVEVPHLRQDLGEDPAGGGGEAEQIRIV